jgi:DNA topoisomerase II
MQGDADDVYFEITLSEENMDKAMQEGLEKKFKLTTTIGTTNMHLFDSVGKIRKYDTPEQSMYCLSFLLPISPLFFVWHLSTKFLNHVSVLEEFYKLRLAFYEKRKVHVSNFVSFSYQLYDECHSN